MASSDPTIDVFLSHAFEDKDKYVLPLTRALDNLAITYWLDAVKIGWGESIVEKINEGLSDSRYVLVFLTESFLSKGWTKRELDAAFAAEIAHGRTILLPVLAAPQEFVFEIYPLLRPKKYLKADLGAESIAAEVSRILVREFKAEWVCNHSASYTGEVWIRILKQESAMHIPHIVSIRWGPWERKVELPVNAERSIVLTHTKGDDGFSIPLCLKVEPSCLVTFGLGKVPPGLRLDINPGWVRWEKP